MAFSYDLLPPIIPDYVPPITNGTFVIPITMIGNKPSLNEFGIKTIQILITNQNGNTINKQTMYYIQGIQVKKSQTEENIYNLKISTQYEAIEKMEKDVFYKLQIRYSRESIMTLEKSATPMNFSEWSSVCLLKKIIQPDLKLEGNKKHVLSSNCESVVPNLFSLSGTLQGNTTEILHSYKIDIYEVGDQENRLFLSTDFLTPQNRNSFSYELPKVPLQDKTYRVQLQYKTLSGYKSDILFFLVKIDNKIVDTDPFYFQTEPDEETGEIKIHIFGKPAMKRNFLIQRSSSETDFEVWENVAIVQFEGGKNDGSQTVVRLSPSNPDMSDVDSIYEKWQESVESIVCERLTWKDRTIESGVFYKYGVSILYKKIGEKGKNNKIKYTDKDNFYITGKSQFNQKAYSCIYDDMYLVGQGGRSLRIRYDPKISNFKYNINDTVQQTLGSRYPFVTRNGLNNYRSFSIGGLITSFMDINDRLNVPSASDFYSATKYNGFLTDETNIQNVVLDTASYNFAKSLFSNSFVGGPYTNSLASRIQKKTFLDSKELSELNDFNILCSQTYNTFFNLSMSYEEFQKSLQNFYNIDNLSNVEKCEIIKQIYNNEIINYNNRMDKNNQIELGNFVLPEELFSASALSNKDKYNLQNNINHYNDIIYEREFREKVIEFLYSQSPKLFRSTTEGNCLVRLTNLSFTPNEQLGRMLYSFSAEACEIDECSLTNFNKYNIYTKGQWKNLKSNYSTTGIYSLQTSQQKDIDLIQELKNLERYNTAKIVSFSKFKIVFDPQSQNKLIPIVNITTQKYSQKQTIEDIEKSFLKRGWLLQCEVAGEKQTIFVNERKQFNFPDNVKFDTIILKQVNNENYAGAKVQFHYEVEYQSTQNDLETNLFSVTKTKYLESAVTIKANNLPNLYNTEVYNKNKLTKKEDSSITYLNVRAVANIFNNNNYKIWGVSLRSENGTSILIQKNKIYDLSKKNYDKLYYNGILSHSSQLKINGNTLTGVLISPNSSLYKYNCDDVRFTLIYKYEEQKIDIGIFT